MIMDCTDAGCPTAAVMFGVPGIRVLDAADDGEPASTPATRPRAYGQNAVGPRPSHTAAHRPTR